MKKMKSYKAIIIISLFVLIFAVFNLINQYLKRNGQINVYFTGTREYFFDYKLADFNIIGVKSGNSIFNIRIIDIEMGRLINAGVISKNKELFYIIKNNCIKLYDFQGKIQYKYTYAEREKEIISGCASNLASDNKLKFLILSRNKDKEYGDELIIYSFDNKLDEIYRQSFKELNPWKVQTADVDGDGVKEISIGVYKTAKFHLVPAKRPFIYNWNGEKLSPKWLGSRLSRPFDDYVFSDIDKDKEDEIIAVELQQDGRKVLNSYKWKGFGFEAVGESKSYTDISDLSVYGRSNSEGKLSARIKEKGTWKQLSFLYSNNRLTTLGTK